MRECLRWARWSTFLWREDFLSILPLLGVAWVFDGHLREIRLRLLENHYVSCARWPILLLVLTGLLACTEAPSKIDSETTDAQVLQKSESSIAQQENAESQNDNSASPNSDLRAEPAPLPQVESEKQALEPTTLLPQLDQPSSVDESPSQELHTFESEGKQASISDGVKSPLSSAKALPLVPNDQYNQHQDPLTFRLITLDTRVIDESFTPQFEAVGKIQLVQTDKHSFAPMDIIHLWLSYHLSAPSVNLSHTGRLTLALTVSDSSGVPEGGFTLRIPLPRHDFEAESAELTFDVLGWQLLNRGRLEVQLSEHGEVQLP